MSEHLEFTPTIEESYRICKRNDIVHLSDANIWPVAKAFLALEEQLAAKDAEIANLNFFMRQRDERIERLLNEIDEWNDAWSERGATLQAFLAELTEKRRLLIEINTWLGNNPEWDLHLEPEWYKRLYEAIEDDPAACDEYAEVRK